MINEWGQFWNEKQEIFTQMGISEVDAKQQYLMSPFAKYTNGLDDFSKSAQEAFNRVEKLRNLEIARQATLLTRKHKVKLQWKDQPIWAKVVAISTVILMPFIAIGLFALAVAFIVSIFNSTF